LPETWQLAWHQAETVKAIRDLNIDIIFNTAMTGDGKSLAAYLETLQSGLPTIGLYPTNELIRDQFHQIRGYLSEFNLEQEPRINSLNGPALELYAQEEGISKAIALETRSSQSEILLTNPDIFHYLHQRAYLSKYDNPDKLWQRIDKLFNLFIFDEFHVFSAPQVASILNILLLMRRTNRRKRYLFLSATPNPQMLEKLDKAGFNYYCIDPVANLKYQFPKKFDQIKELESQNWRQVSRKIDLSFVPLESNFQASENWLKVNKDLILRYFQDFPHSKGAIILNSIATVKRLVPIFRELLKPHGLTVGENTDLSGTKTKLESLTCDLVLGTSTIDVGVDFKINFLIFESSDSGNFIQRLGRLGRHDGYSQENKFHHFTAIALTPKFLVERLFLKDDASLEIKGDYDRSYFNEVIKSNYRQINDFEGYYQRWGAVQSFRLWFDLGSPMIKDRYIESREKFKEDCELVFKSNFKQIAGRVMGWKHDWKTLSGHLGNPIFEDVSSFRGSSPLQYGLYDLTESNEIDRFKIYDLPGILSNLGSTGPVR
jgi:CRISPR-associated endonuclease/helicase Cas3